MESRGKTSWGRCQGRKKTQNAHLLRLSSLELIRREKHSHLNVENWIERITDCNRELKEQGVAWEEVRRALWNIGRAEMWGRHYSRGWEWVGGGLPQGWDPGLPGEQSSRVGLCCENYPEIHPEELAGDLPSRMLEEAVHWEVDTQGGVSRERLRRKSARRGWLLAEVAHCAGQESGPREAASAAGAGSWGSHVCSQRALEKLCALQESGEPAPEQETKSFHPEMSLQSPLLIKVNSASWWRENI